MMKKEEILHKLTHHTAGILGAEDLYKYAILLPLVEKEDGIHLLFEVRAASLRRQPGEICFPGGKIDPSDASAQDAALRETEEELGIEKERVSHVLPLDYLVSSFGMIVYPYTGIIDSTSDVIPNPTEVDEVFSVPLQFFLDNPPQIHYVNVAMEPEESFPFELIPGGKDYEWGTSKFAEHFYVFGDKVIWGLTARIIHHFVERLEKT